MDGVCKRYRRRLGGLDCPFEKDLRTQKKRGNAGLEPKLIRGIEL